MVCLGSLQWSAARNHKLNISLMGLWGLGWLGTITGALLVIGGFSWFFTFTPGLLNSGLAGGELSTLFGAGGLCALLVTRLAGAFWQKVKLNTLFDNKHVIHFDRLHPPG